MLGFRRATYSGCIRAIRGYDVPLARDDHGISFAGDCGACLQYVYEYGDVCGDFGVSCEDCRSGDWGDVYDASGYVSSNTLMRSLGTTSR